MRTAKPSRRPGHTAYSRNTLPAGSTLQNADGAHFLNMGRKAIRDETRRTVCISDRKGTSRLGNHASGLASCHHGPSGPGWGRSSETAGVADFLISE